MHSPTISPFIRRLLPVLAVLAAALFAALPATGRAAGSPRTAPIVPRINGGQQAFLRQVFDRGQSRGLRAGVFAKVGDSITESQAFLAGLACDEARWGSYSGLQDVVRYFSQVGFPQDFTAVWCEVANSFSRASAAAVSGFSVDFILGAEEDPSPGCRTGEAHLDCEYRLLRPAFSLVMLGTNDLQRYGVVRRFRRDMRTLVRRSLTADVIPVLSTIPPRTDSATYAARVDPYNRAIIAVARRTRVPLWNYWRALQGPRIVNDGLHTDGIHPNVFGSYDCDPFCAPLDFGDEGLRYGYNQRNLTALQVLERLRQRIVGDASPGS